jgi:hypothetical protein
MYHAKKISIVCLVIAVSAVMSACSPPASNPLVYQWDCGSHTTLTLHADGTFKIVSAASQRPSVLDGHYSVINNVITVAGPTMAPLSSSTSVEAVDNRTLLLSSPTYGVQQCSRSRN